MWRVAAAGVAQSSLASLPSVTSAAAVEDRTLLPSLAPSDQCTRRLLAVHSSPHPSAAVLGWLPATVREVLECECVGGWVRHERGWSRWQWPWQAETQQQRDADAGVDGPVLQPSMVVHCTNLPVLVKADTDVRGVCPTLHILSLRPLPARVRSVPSSVLLPARG